MTPEKKMNDWLLCWRFRTSAFTKKRVITAHIAMMDRTHVMMSAIPKELQKHKKLLVPQVFDTYPEAESNAKEVTQKIGFKYFGSGV